MLSRQLREKHTSDLKAPCNQSPDSSNVNTCLDHKLECEPMLGTAQGNESTTTGLPSVLIIWF